MPGLQDSLIIVTDLDGSLLDHHTYSWQPAQQWLDIIKQHKTPLIICSSKTSAEILSLQQRLGFQGYPFIAENGASVHVEQRQNSQPFAFSKNYREICQCLQGLRQRYQFHFTGFSDLSVPQIAAITGLTPDNAVLARQRQASEAIIWHDS